VRSGRDHYVVRRPRPSDLLRNGNAGRADRVTVGLAGLAVGTAGSVLAGEAFRLTRRRVRQARTAPTPAATIEAAGQARKDTVAVVVEGYGAASRGESVLFNMLSGFVGAFALVRLSTAGIRSGWWPFRNVRLGGRHIHHFVPGILLAFGSGGAALISGSERAELVLAFPFGAGIGLTFDEAALLLDLRDVYWTREGVVSVQLSLGTAAVLGATILALRMLRRGERRVERQGLIPTEAGEIAAPVPVPA
jgi:hypothetical protein